MERTQHTPGPWRVDNKAFGGSEVGAELVIYSSRGIVAMACTIHEGLVNAEANARLIAAAPDLLAALEALYDQEDWNNEDVPANSPIGMAAAAIAKAKGE